MVGSKEQVRTLLETRSQAFLHRDSATAAVLDELVDIRAETCPQVAVQHRGDVIVAVGTGRRAPANARGSQCEDVRDGRPRPQACATANGDRDA
jgi:hypothetical protein